MAVIRAIIRGSTTSEMRLILTLFAILAAAGLAAALLRPRAAQAAMLNVGDQAPNFSTNAIAGNQTIPIHLKDYRGRRVVLYFYPKDNTPGCTREACAFRDGYTKLELVHQLFRMQCGQRRCTSGLRE